MSEKKSNFNLTKFKIAIHKIFFETYISTEESNRIFSEYRLFIVFETIEIHISRLETLDLRETTKEWEQIEIKQPD